MLDSIKGFFTRKSSEKIIDENKYETSEDASENDIAEEIEIQNDDIVKTKLLLDSMPGQKMSQLHKKLLEDEVEGFAPLHKNDVKIETSYIFEQEDSLEAGIFIRNGLSESINFETIPLVIIDGNKAVLARESIDLKGLGIVPPGTCKQYKVYFKKSGLAVSQTPIKDCKVVFDKNLSFNKTYSVELENLPENFPEYDKNMIKKFMEKLPNLQESQVAISIYELGVNSQGNLIVTMVVRNGCGRSINLDKLPITVYDANKVKIAAGEFKVGNIEINPKKAQLMNCIFQKEDLLTEDMDLSKYEVRFVIEDNEQ